MTSLSDLPAEILHSIFSHCPLSTIGSVRLTNHSLSTIADEHLLPVLELYHCRSSLNRALAVASSPRITRGVRLICLHADRLDPRLGYLDWLRRTNPSSRTYADRDWAIQGTTYPHVPLRIAYHGHNHDDRAGAMLRPARDVIMPARKASTAPDADLRGAHHVFQRLVKEQSELEAEEKRGEGGLVQEVFRALFASCPRLRDVIVTVGDTLAPTTTYRVADFCAALMWPKGVPGNGDDGMRAVQGVLDGVARAVLAEGKTLRMLGVGGVGFHFDDEDGPARLARLQQVVSSVEKLVLMPAAEESLSIGDDNPNNEDSDMARVLAAAAPALQDLTLVLTEMDPESTSSQGSSPPFSPRVVLSQMLGTTTTTAHFPRLRRLRIEWCRTDEDFLVDFLLRHAPTLEFLRLADVQFASVGDGDWTSAFRRVAGRLPRLREVQLRGTFRHGRALMEEDQPQVDVWRVGYVFPGGGRFDMFHDGGRLMLDVQEYIMSGDGAVRPPLPGPVLWRREEVDRPVDALDEYLLYWVKETTP